MGVQGTRVDWEIFGPTMALIIAISIILGIAYLWNVVECGDVGETMGVPHRYRFWSGCYIQPQEARSWIPLDGYYFQEE